MRIVIIIINIIVKFVSANGKLLDINDGDFNYSENDNSLRTQEFDEVQGFWIKMKNTKIL